MAVLDPCNIPNLNVLAARPRQILLVTGNGFDLACGLHTKYSDFINDWVRPKMLNGRYYDSVKHDDDPTYEAEAVGKNENISLWEFYLANDENVVNAIENKTWFDIEQEIENSFKNDGIWSRVKNDIKNGYEIKHAHSTHQNTGGLPVPKRKDDKLLTALATAIVTRYSNRLYVNKVLVNRTFYDVLLEELQLMEMHFRQYLDLVLGSHPDYDSVKNSNLGIIKSTIQRYFGYDKDDMEIKYLTFNYTKTENDSDVVYMHGNNSPIFGIGNLEDIDSDLFIFSKVYRREQENLRKYFEEIDIDNYDLVFYGTSLGLTDLSEYRILTEHLASNGRIVIYYSNYNGRNRRIEVNEQASILFREIYNYKHLEDFYIQKEIGNIAIQRIDLPYKVQDN